MYRLYPTEINSQAMRTKGAALGTATNWIVNFMVVEITPPGIQSLGWKFYIIWTVFNGAFVPIVYFLYPETAGRTLEDLDEYYRTSPPLLVFRDKDAIISRRPEKYVEHEQEAIRRNSSFVGQNAEKITEQFRDEERRENALKGNPIGEPNGQRVENADIERGV